MDFASLGIASVAAITVVCYLIGMGVKASGIDNKWIPVIMGVCGLVLGIAGMFIIPDYPANDYITSAAVGIVSGLAATGINQISKQLNSAEERKMPKVYLSPAYHRQNECCYHRPDGKQCYEALENNEYIDELEVFLRACGIEYKRGVRRTPMSAEDGTQLMYQAVRESNAWGADVHYVSHTNASSDGSVKGCHPMYYPTSKNGKRLGEIMVKYRKEIYPYTVKLIARSNLYELRVPNAVSFYEEHAFHDNLVDITWFHEHMRDIARSAAKGLCEYFGIAYVEPYTDNDEPTPVPSDECVYPATFAELAKGSKNGDVKTAQALLIGYGYNCGGYGADGDYGWGTYNSVEKFQYDKGLAQTGAIDATTWAKLLNK